MKSKYLSLPLLCLSFLLITPMTKGQLILRSSKHRIAMATAASTFSGVFAHYFAHAPLTASLSLSAVTVLAGGWYAYKASPEYKLKKAGSILTGILNSYEYEIAQSERTTEELVSRLKRYYIQYETPLVAAFNDFRSMNAQINTAEDFLEAARKKSTGEDSSTAHGMVHQIESRSKELQNIKHHISNVMLLLKEDPMWFKELKAKYAKDAAQAASDAADAARSNATANSINAAANVAKVLSRKD